MWVCQRCNTQNMTNFCLNCGAAAVTAQEASHLPPPPGIRGMAPQFQTQKQEQFPPPQSAQMSPQSSFQPPPQYAQPQMPPVLQQKQDGMHNLLVVGFVVFIFVFGIASIIWIGVFGAPGAGKIIPILIFLAGLLITVINTPLVVRKIWRVKTFTKTTGVVMNVESRQGMSQFDSSARNTLFSATTRFQTADGRIVDYTPKVWTSTNNYRVGENVPVYYDPQQPEKAVVGRFYNLWFLHFVSGIVGGLFLLGGAIAMLVIFF